MKRTSIMSLMFALAGLCQLACTDGDFAGSSSGNSGSSSNNTSDSGEDGRDDAGSNNELDVDGSGEDRLINDGDGNSDGEDLDLEISEGERKLLQQKCWFAVSGTWIGRPDRAATYEDVFPATTSGNDIASGERFDNVGGIFLGARDEPYIYGEGEIDDAVDNTFDGIVVAPGMAVELRDADNELLYEGDGPLIAGSSFYEENPDFRGGYYASLVTHESLPQWMTDYLDDKGRVESIRLQPARYVKVSTVPDTDCAALTE